MKFVTRAQWGARPPNGSYQSINASSSTAHWEGPHMGTFSHDTCAGRVRSIQSYHMDSNGWLDIAYNGVVCPHGYVFEGRGPGHRSAANGTNDSNGSSYAICYLGGQGDPFTNEAKQGYVDAANWLGRPLNHGHRDWYNTACPGDEIYNWVHAGCPLPGPSPTPPQEDEDLPLHLVVAKNGDGRWWLTDWITKRYISSPDQAAQIIFSTVATGGKIEQNGQNGPVVYDKATVDATPVVQ